MFPANKSDFRIGEGDSRREAVSFPLQAETALAGRRPLFVGRFCETPFLGWRLAQTPYN